MSVVSDAEFLVRRCVQINLTRGHIRTSLMKRYGGQTDGATLRDASDSKRNCTAGRNCSALYNKGDFIASDDCGAAHAWLTMPAASAAAAAAAAAESADDVRWVTDSDEMKQWNALLRERRIQSNSARALVCFRSPARTRAAVCRVSM